MRGNKFCDCGEPVFRRGVCEFCFWCETNLVKGGVVNRRAEPMRKPVVKKFPAWHRMVEEVRELHGNRAFWAQRDSPAEKFHALFRNGGNLKIKQTSVEKAII